MPIAKLSIDLEARLTKLEAGLKQAESLAEKSAGKIRGSFSALTMMFTGLAGAMSVGALKGAFDKYVEGAATMRRLAIVTGTTTEKISGLAGVARLSGTEIDQVQAAMVRLSAGLAKANDETKGMGAAFSALQIDPQKLRAMDTADALQTVAKSFAQIEEGSSKTALAVAIFGRAGAEILPYLQELATSGSLVAKVTTEQGDAARDYQRALRQLDAAQGAIAKTIAADLVPAASAFAKTLAEMVKKSDDVRGAARGLAEDGSIRAWAQNGAMAIAHLIDAFQLVKTLAVEVATPIERLGRNIYTVGALAGIGTSSDSSLAEKKQAYDALERENKAYFARLDKRLDDNRRPATLFSDQLRKRFEASAPAASAGPLRRIQFTGSGSDGEESGRSGRSRAARIDDGSRLIESLRAQIRETQTLTALERLEAEIADGKYKVISKWQIDQARGLAAELDGIRKSDEAARAAQATFMAMRQEGAAIFEAMRTPAEALDARIEHLNDLLEQGAISMETYGRAAQKAGEEFQAIKPALEQLDQFAIEAAKNIQDAFAQFLFDPFSAGADGMLKSFGEVIRRMIANAVAADLAKRLFGDIGSGGGIGGLFGAGIGWLAGAFGGGEALAGSLGAAGGLPLPSFAVGSDYIPRDMVARIHKGERIIPAAQNRGALGGATPIVINQTFNGPTSPADVRRSAGALSRDILSAVSGARRHG